MKKISSLFHSSSLIFLFFNLVVIVLFLSFSNVSSVFADFNTYSFPDSFIDENGNFVGEVIIGSQKDLSLAQKINERLNNTLKFNESNSVSDFNDDDELVEIIYSLDYIDYEDRENIVRDSEDLNYGETLEMVSKTSGISEDETDFLKDGSFDSGLQNRNYKQYLKILNGEFNYAFRDDVDDMSRIEDGIYYEDGDLFVLYTIEFDNALDLSDTDDLKEDFIGTSLVLLEEEFWVISVKNDGADLEELGLVGAGQTLAFVEGEQDQFEKGGKVYDIEVLIVAEDKTSLRINGEVITIDLYETYDFNDISITVIELFSSRRDQVVSHVELLVGGQKLILRDGDDVEVDGDKINDLFEEYEVISEFSDDGDGMKIIEFQYRVQEDIFLGEGDYLRDVLFNVFEIRYDGLISYDTNIIELDVRDDKILVEGILFNEEEFSRDLIYSDTTNGIDGVTYLQGIDEDKRTFFMGSDIDLFLPEGISRVSSSEILIDMSNDNIEGNSFLMSEDIDRQFFYEFTNADPEDGTIEIEEIFEDRIDEDLEASDVISHLGLDLNNAISNDDDKTLQFDLDEFNEPIIAFENDLIMDLSQVESNGVNGFISFYLDTDDVRAETPQDEDESFDVVLNWNNNDDEFELIINENDADFVNRNAAEIDDNSDIKRFVTAYGTIIEYDGEDKDFVKIIIPDEQVRGEAFLTFGGSSSNLSKVIVIRDQTLERIEELERQGFYITRVRNVSLDQVNREKQEKSISSSYAFDTQFDNLKNKIIIGGPAINKASAQIQDLNFPTFGNETELEKDEALIRYYDNYNSVIIYGYEYKDTLFAVNQFLEGENIGDEVYFITS